MIFEKTARLCADYDTAKAALIAADQTTGEIVAAVRNRLQSERQQTAARIAELEGIQGDLSRSQTVRRMAAAELEQLKARAYEITAAEREAFETECAAAETALKDAREIREQLREAFAELSEEVKRLRKSTLGDERLDILAGIVKDRCKEFEDLKG